MSTMINRFDIIKYFLMELHYKLHIADGKIKLFEKVYGVEFHSFQKKIMNLKIENYSKWDNYIEWKAYIKEKKNIENQINDIRNGNYYIEEL